ncbi:DNLZ [Candida oxycetoniae]|uniref:DNLZ n=1 Tax=Candida oxycetoniae TaxID=497107 RepID=A0AAI9WY52_9ASCO|nr:DNLZ [Candida oxycetoniae]KAI3404769.1 DNLZ [Candida oxycetoniae]
MLSRSIRASSKSPLFFAYLPRLVSGLISRANYTSLRDGVSLRSGLTSNLNAMRFQSNSSKPNDSEKLLIEFTCNVCNDRSKHSMSKQAYEHGTVLIECPSCHNRHLIADNLGFIRDDKFNLKDYLESEGQSFKSNVLEIDEIPQNLEHSTGSTADEHRPKQEKIVDLESSKPKIIKDKKE